MSQREYNNNSAGVYCRAPACESYAVSRGFCSKHYQRWLRHRDPNVVLTSRGRPKQTLNPKLQCSVDGCESPAKTRGWCQKHYTRVYRYGSTEISRSPGRPYVDGIKNVLCNGGLSKVDCYNIARSHGMCDRHLKEHPMCRTPG